MKEKRKKLFESIFLGLIMAMATLTGCTEEKTEFVVSEPSYYYFNLTINGNGTVSNLSSGIYKYPNGYTFNITPIPDPGWKFYVWAGDVSIARDPINIMIKMNSNKTVKASFIKLPVYYTLTREQEGEGFINPYKDKFLAGEIVNISITENGFYVFDHWSGDISGNQRNVTIVMDSNKTIKAWFVKKILDGPGTPTIEFVFIPPIHYDPSPGHHRLLEGKVSHVIVHDCAVVVFIKVHGGWWTKPYWESPLTYINSHGEWACNIFTGQDDKEATEVAAFLVSSEYNPPFVAWSDLPQEVYDHALVYAFAERSH